MLEINAESISDLLKVLQLDKSQSDTFMEQELKEAKKKLDNLMKLPKDIEDGMKRSLLKINSKKSLYFRSGECIPKALKLFESATTTFKQR